jgi:hypothetical protein
MLSGPDAWTVFVINFLALGLIWAYVMRSYPSFEAARFWTGSAFAAAAGAAIAMLRVAFPDSLVPLLFAGTAWSWRSAWLRWASASSSISRFPGARPC